MFKKGDLVKFNNKGIELFRYVTGSVALISSDKSVIYRTESASPDSAPLSIYTYDILVSGALYKDVPEEFLRRIVQNEKNIK